MTEHSSRHSVLTKQKRFQDKPRIQSNSGKLTSWLTTGTSNEPVVIAEDNTEPVVITEGDEEQDIVLNDIPEASDESISNLRRGNEDQGSISEGSDSDDLSQLESVPSKDRGEGRGDHPNSAALGEDEDTQDDKKKLGMETSYDGFSIYGRILCLVVRRKGVKIAAAGRSAPISSQAMLENWVSTQAAAEQVDDDEDNS